MSLLGEEGLNEVWGRMKAKILEENQKYRLNLEDGAYSLKIFRQMNICIIHIVALSELKERSITLPEGFWPEDNINNEFIAAASGKIAVKNLSAQQTYSLTYFTSNLLPDEKYKV